jgi:hypothetical protein
MSRHLGISNRTGIGERVSYELTLHVICDHLLLDRRGLVYIKHYIESSYRINLVGERSHHVTINSVTRDLYNNATHPYRYSYELTPLTHTFISSEYMSKIKLPIVLAIASTVSLHIPCRVHTRSSAPREPKANSRNLDI